MARPQGLNDVLAIVLVNSSRRTLKRKLPSAALVAPKWGTTVCMVEWCQAHQPSKYMYHQTVTSAPAKGLPSGPRTRLLSVTPSPVSSRADTGTGLAAARGAGCSPAWGGGAEGRASALPWVRKPAPATASPAVNKSAAARLSLP